MFRRGQRRALGALIATSVLLGASSAFALEIRPQAYVNPELRTAAPSRGKLDDDRAHVYLFATMSWQLDRFGEAGVGYWSDSALTQRTSSVHRRPFYENDAIPFYRYVWAINDDWRVRSDWMVDVKKFSGFHNVDVPVYTDACLYLGA